METKVEFLDMRKKTLRAGKIVAMAELETAYANILQVKNVTNPPAAERRLNS